MKIEQQRSLLTMLAVSVALSCGKKDTITGETGPSPGAAGSSAGGGAQAGSAGAAAGAAGSADAGAAGNGGVAGKQTAGAGGGPGGGAGAGGGAGGAEPAKVAWVLSPLTEADSKFSAATSVAVRDVDGDGRAEVFVSTQFNPNGANYVEMWNGGDILAPGKKIFTIGNVSRIDDFVLGDFDGDKFVDVGVLADEHVHFLKGTGVGTFLPPVVIDIKTVLGARSVAADFTGDGALDILSVRADAAVALLVGDGKGGFTVGDSVALSAPGAYPELTLGFLGVDKAPVVALSVPPQSLRLFRGNSAQVVELPTIALPVTGSRPMFRDSDHDGLADLLFPHPQGEIIFGKGNSSGMFDIGSVPIVTFGVEGGLSPIVVGDFNGDGISDVAGLRSNGDLTLALGRLDIIPGKTDGFVVSNATFGKQGMGVWRLAVGDIDGNGKDDIACPGRGVYLSK